MSKHLHSFSFVLYAVLSASIAKADSLTSTANAADWSSVAVSLLSALLLFSTLMVAIRSNSLISKQLRANKPFLVCENVEILERHTIESDRKNYHLKLVFIWKNYGRPPALTTKFSSVIKDSPDQPIDISTSMNHFKTISSYTLGEGAVERIEIDIDLPIENTPDDSFALERDTFSAIATFKDSHGSTYIVERCYQVFWTSNDTFPIEISLVQTGPDNKEFETNC